MDGVRFETDFRLGYYVCQEGGHDRYVTAEEFETFTPREAAKGAE